MGKIKSKGSLKKGPCEEKFFVVSMKVFVDEKFEIRVVGVVSSKDFSKGKEVFLDFRAGIGRGGVNGFRRSGDGVVDVIIVVCSEQSSWIGLVASFDVYAILS